MYLTTAIKNYFLEFLAPALLALAEKDDFETDPFPLFAVELCILAAALAVIFDLLIHLIYTDYYTNLKGKK